MPRVSATIEDGVFERMEKYRGEINFSKVFKEAVPDMVADAIREVEERKGEMEVEAKIIREAINAIPEEIRRRITLKVEGDEAVAYQEFDFRPSGKK